MKINKKKMLGGILLVSPFVGMFSYIVYSEGLLVACGIFGVTAALLGIIVLGCNLLR